MTKENSENTNPKSMISKGITNKKESKRRKKELEDGVKNGCVIKM